MPPQPPDAAERMRELDGDGGASMAAAEAPPPLAEAPPPPLVAAEGSGARQQRRARGRGDATYFVQDLGRLTFYSSKMAFEATCYVHHACRKTRTSKAPTGWRQYAVPGQGRPCGELVAWLQGARSLRGNDHEGFAPPHSDRKAARELLKASAGAAQDLLLRERRWRPDEGDSEPE